MFDPKCRGGEAPVVVSFFNSVIIALYEDFCLCFLIPSAERPVCSSDNCAIISFCRRPVGRLNSSRASWRSSDAVHFGLEDCDLLSWMAISFVL